METLDQKMSQQELLEEVVYLGKARSESVNGIPTMAGEGQAQEELIEIEWVTPQTLDSQMQTVEIL